VLQRVNQVENVAERKTLAVEQGHAVGRGFRVRGGAPGAGVWGSGTGTTPRDATPRGVPGVTGMKLGSMDICVSQRFTCKALAIPDP